MILLKRQFGEKASIDELERVAYSTDASQIDGNAVAVVWPENKEDVYKLVRYAHRKDMKITPRGAGTGLVGSAVPQDSIVMDVSRMDRVISIDIKSKTVIVEPGIVLDELNKALESHGLVFPVLPASHAVCTIGGMISTNAAGMRSVNYGRMIDWIDELEIIDGMGRMFNAKGDKIKNFCGTEGTIGIITKAKLNLTEPENKRSMDYLKFETINGMLKKYNSLAKDNLIAVEYINKSAAKLAGLAPYFHLFIEYKSMTGEIFNNNQIENIWDIRKQTGVKLSAEGYTLKEDPKVPQDKIPDLMRWLEENEVPSFGHLGIGVIHPRFKDSKLIDEMYRLVLELRGEVTGEHGIGLKKKKYMDYKLRERLTRLKASYDPKNILNPGIMI